MAMFIVKLTASFITVIWPCPGCGDQWGSGGSSCSEASEEAMLVVIGGVGGRASEPPDRYWIMQPA